MKEKIFKIIFPCGLLAIFLGIAILLVDTELAFVSKADSLPSYAFSFLFLVFILTFMLLTAIKFINAYKGIYTLSGSGSSKSKIILRKQGL